MSATTCEARSLRRYSISWLTSLTDWSATSLTPSSLAANSSASFWFPRAASWPAWTLLAGVLGELTAHGLWRQLAPLLSTLLGEQGAWGRSVLYLALSVTLSLVACVAGMAAARETALALHR